MKKLWLIIIIITSIIFLFSFASTAAEFSLGATSAVLMDGSSGRILFEQNADAKVYPASVTKMMMLVLILEAVDKGTISLDDKVTTSAKAASMGGSQVYLYEGEVRTVDEMIIAIAVGSGNDAAYAMAEYLGGTMENFVDMMNKRAKELGMNNTNFVNPHGLHDENHYTTARDMATLAYHALQVPHMLDYTSIYEYEFRPDPKKLVLWNTNRLLKWYDGTDGLKTGYTPEAGRNLVATAVRDNLRLISVVMGVAEAKGHFTQSMELLNYGFNTYKYHLLCKASDIIATVPVGKGNVNEVEATVAQDIGVTTAKNEKAELSFGIETKSGLSAPIAKGAVVGQVTVYNNGKKVTTKDIVAAQDVTKGGFLRTWQRLLNAISI